MERRHWAVAGILALMLFCSASGSPATEKKTPPHEKTAADSRAGAANAAPFDMKEVSLFDQKERAAISKYPIFSGQIASLRTQPAKEVKAYPKLNSEHPLYGSIVFDGAPGKPGRPTKFHFVLDESGTAENANQKATKPAADKPAVNNRPKSRYDRLYIDADRNLDLTNDAVVSPMNDPPDGLARLFDGPQTTVIFNPVSIPLGEDSKAKRQAVSVLPVIVLYGKTYDGNAGRMVFMATSARKGEVRLGTRAYSALLVPRTGMIGRMNHRDTPLFLGPLNGPQPLGSYPGMNTLAAVRQSGGEFYRISATPSGDQLSVCAVGGERGVFELSVGDKHIKPFGMVGCLAWKEPTLKESVLLLGEIGSSIQAETAKYRLPLGDYRPLLLIVDCGDLRVSLRADYTLNLGAAGPAGSIEVRKEKPCVLDFATKPEVHFRAPTEGETFKPGDQIRLAAVLRIPHNGLMIDGMEGRSKTVREMNGIAEDGKQTTSARYASLNPTVAITDSSGKKVAEGTMPFG